MKSKDKELLLLAGVGLLAYFYMQKGKASVDGSQLGGSTTPYGDAVGNALKTALPLGVGALPEAISNIANVVGSTLSKVGTSGALALSSPSVQSQMANIEYLEKALGTNFADVSFTPQGALYVRPTAEAGTSAFTAAQKAIDTATRATMAATETYGYTPYTGGAVVLNIAKTSSGSYAPTAGAAVAPTIAPTASPPASVLPTASSTASRLARGLM